MKIRLVVALVGLAISFALPTFAQQKDTITDPQLVEQLKAIGKKTGEVFNKNDAAALAAAPPTIPEALPESVGPYRVRRLLGIAFPVDEAEKVLASLEFGVERLSATRLRVTVPPHRLDVQEGPADLIEELVRQYGYDRLPATLLSDQLPPQDANESLAFEERVRDASQYIPIERLALSPQCGFNSALTGNPLSPAEQEAKLRLVAEVARRVWGALS